MSYTDDAVKAKLSATNETQEGITGVAQWIMFHRRHAHRTAELWLQRLKDSNASKRLNLLYLANEVAQQSRARKKMEFVEAFTPVISEGTLTAYKSASQDIQLKLRRLVEVWRQRQVFDAAVQQNIDKGIDGKDIDRGRGGGAKKAGLGGSLFSSSSSAPPEIQPLVTAQNSLTKAEIAYKPALETAHAEYAKVLDPDAKVPTAPVQAHNLSNVLKVLANAEGAVAESIKCRKALIDGLEKLLQSNRIALANEETYAYDLSNNMTTIDAKKREVEDSIMRGLSAGYQPQSGYDDEVNRPDIEQLTPPPVEAFTPEGTPPPAFTTTTGADVSTEQPVRHEDRLPPVILPDQPEPRSTTADPRLASVFQSQSPVSFENGLTNLKRGPSPEGPNGGPQKRQSISKPRREELAEFESEVALDDDVAKMLG